MSAAFLAEIRQRDQIGRDWLAQRHSFDLPEAKYLAILTSDEMLAFVEIAEAAQRLTANPFGRLNQRAFYALREALGRLP